MQALWALRVEDRRSFFFFFLVTQHGMWDLSSLIRDGSRAPAFEALSPNHQIPREVPRRSFLQSEMRGSCSGSSTLSPSNPNTGSGIVADIPRMVNDSFGFNFVLSF